MQMVLGLLNVETICFYMLVIFVSKQIYHASHFRGLSRVLPTFLGIYSFVAIVFMGISIIWYGIHVSWLFAILSIVVGIVILMIINSILSKIAMSLFKRENDDVFDGLRMDESLFSTAYNRKCDEVTATLSIIGVIAIPVLIIIQIIYRGGIL